MLRRWGVLQPVGVVASRRPSKQGILIPKTRILVYKIGNTPVIPPLLASVEGFGTSNPALGALDANIETFPILIRKVLKENGLLVTRLRVRVNERCLSYQVPSRTSIGRHSYSWVIRDLTPALSVRPSSSTRNIAVQGPVA